MKHRRRQIEEIIGWLCFALVVAQLVLMIGSWLVMAVSPDHPVRSLLSGEGLRWMCDHSVEVMASPILVWLLLIAMAYGSLRTSKLIQCIRKKNRNYRERLAWRTTIGLAILFVVLLLFLTLPPQAVLRNAEGYLYPSSFSDAFISSMAVAICVLSVVYGCLSGTLRSLREVVRCLTIGIADFLPVWLLYFLAALLVCAIRFFLI